MTGRKGWYIPVSQLEHIDTGRTIPHYPLSLIKSIIILNEKENENEDAEEDEAEIIETV